MDQFDQYIPLVFAVIIGGLSMMLIFRTRSEKKDKELDTFDDIIKKESKINNSQKKANDFLSFTTFRCILRDSNNTPEFRNLIIQELNNPVDITDIKIKASEKTAAGLEIKELKALFEMLEEKEWRIEKNGPTAEQMFTALINILYKSKCVHCLRCEEYNLELKSVKFQELSEQIAPYLSEKENVLPKINILNKIDFDRIVSEFEPGGYVLLSGKLSVIFEDKDQYFSIRVKHPVSVILKDRYEFYLDIFISQKSLDEKEVTFFRKCANSSKPEFLKVFGKATRVSTQGINVSSLEVIPFAIYI